MSTEHGEGQHFRGKYPVGYPWSRAARELVANGRKDGMPDGLLRNLLLEHLHPWSLTLDDAIQASQDLRPLSLAHLLHSRYAAAVITADEDKRLTASGVAHSMPPDAQGGVWARALHAGLDVEGYAPLASSVEDIHTLGE